MVKKNDKAFPVNWGAGNFNSGMTIRQFYAAMAMKSLLQTGLNIYGTEQITKMAFKQADSMINYENEEEK